MRKLQVILHVHDEIIVEVDADDPTMTPGLLTEIMETPPDWCDGLPLAAGSFESKRYKKG